MATDPVNHPAHYCSSPSGIECIQVAEHLSFCLGNAIKYIWRCDSKGDSIEQLQKAIWYLQREIARRKQLQPQPQPEPRSIFGDPVPLTVTGTGIGGNTIIPVASGTSYSFYSQHPASCERQKQQPTQRTNYAIAADLGCGDASPNTSILSYDRPATPYDCGDASCKICVP